MAHQFTPALEYPAEGGLPPAADAAGRTGAVYVDTSKYHKVIVEVHINQGAANTVAVSLSQASDAAGTGAAAVVATSDIYTNLDVAANGSTFTRQTAAASFTTDAATKQKIIVFELDPVKLGTAKRFLAVTTGASAAGNITSALIRGVPRHQRL